MDYFYWKPSPPLVKEKYKSVGMGHKACFSCMLITKQSSFFPSCPMWIAVEQCTWGCPSLKAHTSLWTCLPPCTRCSDVMGAEIVFTKAEHFREVQVHAWRAVAVRSVMSSHLTFLHHHRYRIFLFLFPLYLQFLNSLMQRPPWRPLLISSTWREFSSVASPSSPVLLCLLLPGLDLSSIWSLFQTLSSMHVCSIFGEGNGTPLQYSCLENPMEGGAWWTAVYGIVKSQTRLSDFTFTFHFHSLEKEMATHSSVLAWRIPGMGSHRIGHDWSDLAACSIFGLR